MCFFITIGVRDDNAAALTAAVSRGLSVVRVANPSVLRKLPVGYRTFVLTSNGCSCGLYHPGSLPTDTRDVGRPKHAQRGWLVSKVERARRQAARRLGKEDTFVGLQPDVRDWLCDTADTIGELAYVVHWYNGSVETESLPLGCCCEVTCQDIRATSTLPAPDELILIRGVRRWDEHYP